MRQIKRLIRLMRLYSKHRCCWLCCGTADKHVLYIQVKLQIQIQKTNCTFEWPCIVTNFFIIKPN